jgi:signal transduction histidine kinase
VEQHPEMQMPAAELSIMTPHIVVADDASLNQAISNLLANAVKFVPEGVTPTVRITSERCAVTGEPITLDALRYWNVDLQEAYRGPAEATARWKQVHAEKTS